MGTETMSYQVLITKSYKSVGIAILLTLFLGPMGLFYASVTGGIVMLFVPVVTSVILLYRTYTGAFLSDFSIMGMMESLLTVYVIYVLYWVVSIMWAIWATVEYNSDLERQARSVGPPHETPVSYSPSSEFIEWAKANPGKSVNEYYIFLKRKA